jgi:hypothetical protein
MATTETDSTCTSGERSMSAKTNKKSPPQPQIYNAADFKSIYVNFVQTAASPTDISIGIGETSPTQTGATNLEMKARIVMAPLQAKIMAAMLVQAIQQFEKQYGEIVIPPAVSTQLAVPVLKGRHSPEGV